MIGVFPGVIAVDAVTCARFNSSSVVYTFPPSTQFDERGCGEKLLRQISGAVAISEQIPILLDTVFGRHLKAFAKHRLQEQQSHKQPQQSQSISVFCFSRPVAVASTTRVTHVDLAKLTRTQTETSNIPDWLARVEETPLLGAAWSPTAHIHTHTV